MTEERLGPEGVGVWLWANPPGAAKWGSSVWGAPSVWPLRAWQETTCQVRESTYAWGANRALGVLSVAAGGSFDLTTYDPNRDLDPLNTLSPFAADIHPGSYIRLTYLDQPYAFGIIDSLTFSLADSVGRIAGTDPVGVLSNVTVPAPVTPAPTLRAYARQIIATIGYPAITVEPDPPDGDPLIGLPDVAPTGEVGVWQSIADAAIDCLRFAWIDAELVVRFWPHGDPLDRGLTIGLEGIPNIDLVSSSTADGIVNRVKARDLTGPVLPTVENLESIKTFGPQEIDRTVRRVPDAAAWADRVLADRAFAALEILPSAIIPTTSDELLQLLTMGGVELVRVRDDVPTPIVEVDARSLGLQVRVSPDGWQAAILTYISNLEWSDDVIVPPEPPIDPPPQQTVSRSTTSTKAARISLTSGGAKYGAGASDQAAVGAWSGWQNRMLVAFSPDFSAVTEVVSATLRLHTSTQVNIGFGSAPKIRIDRLTAAWSEGSLSTPGSGNSVVWPGPNITATGEKVASITRTEGALVDIDITAIVRAWAPVAAGGSGAANHGLRLSAYTETSTTYTTEFDTDDFGTASFRPILLMSVKIPA